jgi:hypothetical protein
LARRRGRVEGVVHPGALRDARAIVASEPPARGRRRRGHRVPRQGQVRQGGREEVRGKGQPADRAAGPAARWL